MNRLVLAAGLAILALSAAAASSQRRKRSS
jgi:hypothetical protein